MSLSNYGFSEAIKEIDAELSAEWQPGAFAWIDKHHGGAWISATNRMDAALIDPNGKYKLSAEAKIYSKEVVRLLRLYKKEMKINEDANFISAIQYRGENNLRSNQIK